MKTELERLQIENAQLKEELKYVRTSQRAMLRIKRAAESVIETLPAGGVRTFTLRKLEEAVVNIEEIPNAA